MAHGPYVYLEVFDTGCGIDEDGLNHMRDPFCTTKPSGRGLGLAAVQGIVRWHSGAVKVYSEVGRESCIKVLFPASDLETDSSSDSEDSRNRVWSSSEAVLVVDDEPLVRAMVSDGLSAAGCTVLTCSDRREAVELFRTRANDIGVVLLDMTMLHMDGQTAFAEMKKIQPDVSVILMSGYNEQEATSRFAGKGLPVFSRSRFGCQPCTDS